MLTKISLEWILLAFFQIKYLHTWQIWQLVCLQIHFLLLDLLDHPPLPKSVTGYFHSHRALWHSTQKCSMRRKRTRSLQRCTASLAGSHILRSNHVHYKWSCVIRWSTRERACHGEVRWGMGEGMACWPGGSGRRTRGDAWLRHGSSRSAEPANRPPADNLW